MGGRVDSDHKGCNKGCNFKGGGVIWGVAPGQIC